MKKSTTRINRLQYLRGFLSQQTCALRGPQNHAVQVWSTDTEYTEYSVKTQGEPCGFNLQRGLFKKCKLDIAQFTDK